MTPAQVFAPDSQLRAGAVGLLIWILPLLAGYAIWYRDRLDPERRFNSAPWIALIWLLWTLSYLLGLQPEAVNGPVGLYITIMLFGYPLWDWFRSLFGARVRWADGIVALLVLTLAGLLLWPRVFAPAPLRPPLLPVL